MIKIIQITDTHLFKENSLLFNINTNLSFKKIISKMQCDLIDTDAIFLTGDLSQDESIESYELIADSLKNLNKKIFWIPGNHDSINNMSLVFNKSDNFVRKNTLSTDLWDFIFLNTKKEGRESGFLTDNDFLLLEIELKKERFKPIALVMHHHPLEVQTPLIDNYILENKDRLLGLLHDSRIQLIICGHVHNDYTLKYRKTCIETSPATCFQFKKGTANLIIESNIGYKIYYFSSNNYVAKTRLWKN